MLENLKQQIEIMQNTIITQNKIIQSKTDQIETLTEVSYLQKLTIQLLNELLSDQKKKKLTRNRFFVSDN